MLIGKRAGKTPALFLFQPWERQAPDTGKGSGSGYESDTAEDFGKVIEVETDGKPQAETGDYGGQEGGKSNQGEQQNVPREEASPHAQGGQHKIETAPLETLPENAQDAFKKYEQYGWKGNVPGQTKGTCAGGKYRNDDGFLPSTDHSGKPIEYRKFDVNNRAPGQGRDAQRFVVGSDGSIYYTDEHYHGFVKIK